MESLLVSFKLPELTKTLPNKLEFVADNVKVFDPLFSKVSAAESETSPDIFSVPPGVPPIEASS